jgi:hypothetical protein
MGAILSFYMVGHFCMDMQASGILSIYILIYAMGAGIAKGIGRSSIYHIYATCVHPGSRKRFWHLVFIRRSMEAMSMFWIVHDIWSWFFLEI